MHFFLFNDILVFANKNDVKKQTDMTKLSSQWPLELVWVRPLSFHSHFQHAHNTTHDRTRMGGC
jgi:hypothetical protein